MTPANPNTLYAKLYRTALTWTDGDADQAKQLVERWYQGRLQAPGRPDREPEEETP